MSRNLHQPEATESQMSRPVRRGESWRSNLMSSVAEMTARRMSGPEWSLPGIPAAEVIVAGMSTGGESVPEMTACLELVGRTRTVERADLVLLGRAETVQCSVRRTVTTPGLTALHLLR